MNILLFGMEFSKLINCSTYMHWSCPLYYGILHMDTIPKKKREKRERKEPNSTFYFAHIHIPQKKQKGEEKKTLKKDPKSTFLFAHKQHTPQKGGKRKKKKEKKKKPNQHKPTDPKKRRNRKKKEKEKGAKEKGK